MIVHGKRNVPNTRLARADGRFNGSLISASTKRIMQTVKAEYRTA
jgi:hypothetical protein